MGIIRKKIDCSVEQRFALIIHFKSVHKIEQTRTLKSARPRDLFVRCTHYRLAKHIVFVYGRTCGIVNQNEESTGEIMKHDNGNGTSSRRSRNRNSRRGGGGGNQNRARVYDSNGPDVRIRGTANQVAEKYMALAKDSASAGDHVMAESYYQFAEHYQRIISNWDAEIEAYENNHAGHNHAWRETADDRQQLQEQSVTSRQNNAQQHTRECVDA